MHSKDWFQCRLWVRSSSTTAGYRLVSVCVTLPESQPLVQLLQKASVELVNGVDVGEEEGHQAFGHGVLLDDGAAEPLGGQKKKKNTDKAWKRLELKFKGVALGVLPRLRKQESPFPCFFCCSQSTKCVMEHNN